MLQSRSRILKKADFREKLGENCASAVINHIMPKTRIESFGYIFVANTTVLTYTLPGPTLHHFRYTADGHADFRCRYIGIECRCLTYSFAVNLDLLIHDCEICLQETRYEKITNS